MTEEHDDKFPRIVPPGKIVDFIDGTLRDDSPEEYVRQEILKSLVREYKYPRKEIAVEWPLRIGSRRVRADIVIFRSGTKQGDRNQSSIEAIVECKRPGTNPAAKADGQDQLISYLAACPTSKFGMWTNGTDLSAFRLQFEGSERAVHEIPDLPHYGDEANRDRPRFADLRPAASDSLLFAFRRSHDYISGNQGMQKPEAFWELLKLIFCKIHDERHSQAPEFYTTPTERASATGVIRVTKRIGKLFNSVKAKYPQIFKANEEIELQGPILAYIVTQLQMFSLLTSDVDIKGKAYEEIVGSNLRGDRGEFFTPRNVCAMMVAITAPTENTLIVDPACGTGGFLISAMNFVLDNISHEVTNSDRPDALKNEIITDRKRAFLAKNLVGLDFNPNLVKASKMNMVMNDDGSAGLYQANSLASPSTWSDDLRERGLLGNVDVVLTNPPFGSKIPIDNPAILDQYDLGHSWSWNAESDSWVRGTATTARPPEILFIERCVSLLKEGSGIAAMVLPDGILGSPGLGFVRQWLLEQTNILASVDLHPDTFQPGTSVQTSVLVVQRKSAEQREVELAYGSQPDYDVFMAICDHIGHDKRGNAVYLRDENGFEVIAEVEEATTVSTELDETFHHLSQQRVIDDDTQAIAAAYRTWRENQ